MCARTASWHHLLTCKLIYRVAAPLFYRTITLHSPPQTASLAATLRANCGLASWVRSITLEGVWMVGLDDVLGRCTSVQSLDLVLDDGWLGKECANSTKFMHGAGILARGINANEVLGFCDALGRVRDLKTLTIRKENSTYLTQLGPRTILQSIGKHMMQWKRLEHVELAFRYTNAQPLPIMVPSSPQSLVDDEHSDETCISLSAALAQAPKLRTVSTVMPAIWNDALLQISANPALQQIRFTAPPTPGAPASLQCVFPTALYFKEASKHPRLIELILAGSSVMTLEATSPIPLVAVAGRGRAKTVDSAPHVVPPPSNGAGAREVAVEMESEVLQPSKEAVVGRTKVGMRRSSAA
ncbi:hypothetical protein EUX98_g2526 [Antrodiella citrinella]|uniref:Uncharacterized protein n=1 Tax=Antrodiella citrinella TaxID=2447956 RepID=A0A4V3XJ43_9APHY|nr:hypothetical protein EUX98_g2526 [Antrodiella citrinella]